MAMSSNVKVLKGMALVLTVARSVRGPSPLPVPSGRAGDSELRRRRRAAERTLISLFTVGCLHLLLSDSLTDVEKGSDGRV